MLYAMINTASQLTVNFICCVYLGELCLAGRSGFVSIQVSLRLVSRLAGWSGEAGVAWRVRQGACMRLRWSLV